MYSDTQNGGTKSTYLHLFLFFFFVTGFNIYFIQNRTLSELKADRTESIRTCYNFGFTFPHNNKPNPENKLQITEQ